MSTDILPVTTLRRVRAGAAAGSIVLVAALVAGCTSAAATKGSAVSTTPAGYGQGAAGGVTGIGGRGGAAASGTIAAISGTTLQVQSSTAQTAVVVSAATRYTERATTTLSAVAVGSCIVAMAPAPASSGSSASAPVTRPTSITAASVTVAAPTNGSCTAGFAGGTRAGTGGQRPSGFPTGARPSGVPTGARPGGGGARFGEVINGKVTAVSGSTITVSVVPRAAGASGGSSASTATPYLAAVRTTSATTYSHTVTVTKAALKVGLCATAFGSTDSGGTVKATRLGLSTPVAGRCTTGFGTR